MKTASIDFSGYIKKINDLKTLKNKVEQLSHSIGLDVEIKFNVKKSK